MNTSKSKNSERVTGLVLCGGRGRRVGGADKPLLSWRGTTLVEAVIERLQPQVTRVLISANRNLATYRALAPTVTDTLPGFQGPLAGIAAGLEATTDPWLFVCPGDAPLLALDLVARLQAAIGPAPFAIAHDGEHPQYLHLLVRSAPARADLAGTLARGERSVHGWIANRAVVADCADLSATFADVDCPQGAR